MSPRSFLKRRTPAYVLLQVFFGEEAKTEHMLLVSNDISHFRRFVTMHKLNFELHHRHDRLLTRPAISCRERNRAYEGDFIPINVDLLIEKFDVSPSNVWYNNPDQTEVGIQKSVMTKARRLTVPSPEEYVDHQKVIRHHLTFSAFKRLELP